MKYTDEKKQEYWDHFLTIKNFWPYGFTEKRLDKIKDIVWKDEDFWDDILQRHGAFDCSPQSLKDRNPGIYQHCFGNFAGMLTNIMVKNKILK